jgi:biopolymer transport protein ExbD
MGVRAVRKPPKGEIGKIMMAPMVDIVFQLLIFFLIASEVRPVEADFTTNLPAGTGPLNRKVPAKQAFKVYLKKTDAQCTSVFVSIDGTDLGRAPEGFRILESRLRDAVRVAKDNMLLVIDGDPDVKLQFIANTLDAAVEAEVPSITFGKPKT